MRKQLRSDGPATLVYMHITAHAPNASSNRAQQSQLGHGFPIFLPLRLLPPPRSRRVLPSPRRCHHAPPLLHARRLHRPAPHPHARRVRLGADGTPPATATSPRQFGDIVVLNNALTEGPGAGSARVGTAQGFGVRVSERGVVTDLSMHMVMEAGEHRGSSVAVKGRIDVGVAVRESVVVGGTGRFRLARGYMVSRSYDYSLAGGGVVEIDVYLQH
uniref:Dirigent protein n=1 Tax=Oryza brachyantha TaxID=4533 RepID=J3N6U5_ORYBR